MDSLMRFPRWGVFVAALVVAGCDVEVGLPDDDDKNGDDSTATEIQERLQGSWSTVCLFREGVDGADDTWSKQNYVFSSDQVTWTERSYPDSLCLDADRVVEFQGDFDIDDEIIVSDGQAVWEIYFDFNSADLIEGDGDDPELVERYDILSLRDDDSGFFLGTIDDNHTGDSTDDRPDEVDFSTEYEKD